MSFIVFFFTRRPGQATTRLNENKLRFSASKHSMRKRKYVSLDDSNDDDDNSTGVMGNKGRGGGGWGFNDTNSHSMQSYPEEEVEESENAEHRVDTVSRGKNLPPFPVPQCHNIVSTSQIMTSQPSINLQRLADLYPFTTYDRKRFAAITIRLANQHCTCLLFGSGKLVITGSTSFRWPFYCFVRRVFATP